VFVLNLLISTLGFIFATCQTSKRRTWVNGGFLNGAKMYSSIVSTGIVLSSEQFLLLIFVRLTV